MPRQNRARSVDELLRDLESRIRLLEGRRTVKLGPWALEYRASDGALVARNTASGTTTVVAP